MEISTALSLTVAVPLLGAVLCFLAPLRAPAIGLTTATALSWPTAVCVAALVGGLPAEHAFGAWQAPLGIVLYLDGAAALMLAVSWFIGTLVSLYALAYYRGTETGHSFWPLWMLLWTGLNALFLSRDVFNLYVTLELVGLAAVAMVALPGGREAIVAAMRYLLVSLAGSLGYLLGVALLYARYSTVDLSLLAAQAVPDAATWTAIALMTTGLLLKAAVFPLHFWLPDAHANAPAPVSALLSALVVKGSLFILYRLWAQAFHGSLPPFAGELLGVLACGAILWGSVKALTQQRLKMLVAYSTVAQIGYLVLALAVFVTSGAPLSAWTGGFYLIAAHAFAKSSMFLAAGNLLYSAGHDRIDDLSAAAATAPVSLVAFALGGISIVGLPPSGGFLGKWLLLNGALFTAPAWVAVILLGGLIAAAYVLRVVAVAFSASVPATATRPVPRLMEWCALVASAMAIMLGLFSALPIDLLSVGAPAEGPLLQGGTSR